MYNTTGKQCDLKNVIGESGSLKRLELTTNAVVKLTLYADDHYSVLNEMAF